MLRTWEQVTQGPVWPPLRELDLPENLCTTRLRSPCGGGHTSARVVRQLEADPHTSQRGRRIPTGRCQLPREKQDRSQV